MEHLHCREDDMVRRISQISDNKTLNRLFGVEIKPKLVPEYNVGPTSQVRVIGVLDKQKFYCPMRWGFVAHWAKEISESTFHTAKATSLETSKLWQPSFLEKRCIIPADGYFIWSGQKFHRQPYRVMHEDGSPMALAGIWSWNKNLNVLSCAVITTKSSGKKSVKDGPTPVILEGDDIDRWLNEPTTEVLQPYTKPLRVRPVSKCINDGNAKGPKCIVEIPFSDVPRWDKTMR